MINIVKIIFCLWFLLFSAIVSCSKESPTEITPPQLDLTVVEVTASGVLLLATVENAAEQQELILYRNGVEVSRQSADTSQLLLADDELAPTCDYSYRISVLQDNREIAVGETLTITTGDTVSQLFTWHIDTLGIGGSRINDVYVVNENNIWAVGDVRTPNDTSGNTGIEFNAVRWDGQQWEYLRIPVKTSWDSTLILPSRAIHGFSATDIWVFSDGGAYSYWNGNSWLTEYITERRGGIYHIGGVLDNLYFVGSGGNITLYDGQQWRLLPQAGDFTYYDVDGNEEFAFAVGYNDLAISEAIRIKNIALGQIFASSNYMGNPQTGDYGRFTTLQLLDKAVYFVTRAGLLKYHYPSESVHFIRAEALGTNNYDIHRISGNGVNDIIMISNWGNVVHFNGKSWRTDNYLFNHFGPANFFPQGLHLKDNIAVAVGYLSGFRHAIIARGYR